MANLPAPALLEAAAAEDARRHTLVPKVAEPHDYYRHGTSTLFAAVDIATGQVTATSSHDTPARKFWRSSSRSSGPYRHLIDDDGEPVELHLVMDNHAADNHMNVEDLAEPEPAVRRAIHPNPRLVDEPRRGLVRHRGTPSHPPRRLHVHQSLNTEIRNFIDAWNDERTFPFVWIKTAAEIQGANRPTTLYPRY